MQCFDHQMEFVGLCGWCGKQVCPRCIGRQDGRKKYCRECAAKMGDFRSGETKQQESPVRAAPTPHHEIAHHEEEQPRITPLAPKRPVIALGHPKPVDPHHFTLDNDEPMIFRHDEAPRRAHHDASEAHAPVHHEAPHVISHPAPHQEVPSSRVAFHTTPNTPVHHEAPKPALREAPKHDSGFEPFKPFPLTKPQPKVGSAAGSFRPAVPGASAASSALGMFAASAQQTKNSPPTHSSSPSMHSTTPVHPGTGMHASMQSAGPTLQEAVHTAQQSGDDKPHLQTGKPVTQNSGSSAASKAMSFLAEAAKETAQKKQ